MVSTDNSCVSECPPTVPSTLHHQISPSDWERERERESEGGAEAGKYLGKRALASSAVAGQRLARDAISNLCNFCFCSVLGERGGVEREGWGEVNV